MERAAWTPTFVNRQPAGICCQDSGNSNWGSEITWRGGDGRDVGRRFQKEGTFMWMYDKLNWYCKALINQLEINNCFKKRER